MDTTPPPLMRTRIRLDEGGWPAVRSLAREALVAMLDAERCWDLIVTETGGTHRYVQFHCDPADRSFYAELSSNHHLATHAQLGLDEELALLERGWNPPAGITVDDDGVGLAYDASPTRNFWRYAEGLDGGLDALDELARCHTFEHHAVLELQVFECAMGDEG